MGAVSYEIEDPNAPALPVWFSGQNLDDLMDEVRSCWFPDGDSRTVDDAPDAFLIRVYRRAEGGEWEAEVADLLPEHARRK